MGGVGDALGCKLCQAAVASLQVEQRVAVGEAYGAGKRCAGVGVEQAYLEGVVGAVGDGCAGLGLCSEAAWCVVFDDGAQILGDSDGHLEKPAFSGRFTVRYLGSCG